MDFTVNLWLTHPDAGDDDDCMTRAYFATEAEARAAVASFLNGTSTHFDYHRHRDCAFLEIDGPGCYEVVDRPGVAARARHRAAQDERSVDDYNDAMGW